MADGVRAEREEAPRPAREQGPSAEGCTAPASTAGQLGCLQLDSSSLPPKPPLPRNNSGASHNLSSRVGKAPLKMH